MPEADNQLFLLLGRLEGKVDTLIKGQEHHASRVDALEARVSAIEDANLRLTGAKTLAKHAGKAVWAVVAAVGGYLLSHTTGK